MRRGLRRLLESDPGDPAFAERMVALRGVFESHAADQEGALFPRVCGAFGEAELEVLGADIRASRPPVWVVTTESGLLRGRHGGLSARSAVSLP
jgi:hypothetical protein